MKLKLFVVLMILTLVFLLIGCDKSQKSDNTTPIESTVEKIVFKSNSLKKDMNVNIYFPPDYNKNEKYPVLYLIHGFNKDENFIYNFTRATDKLLLEGKINPLIIVAPKVDQRDGNEDYIYKEIVPYIDSNYNTISSKEARYIGGSSMGGYIALNTGFKHPNMFSKIGGHQPAIYTDNPEDINNPIFLAKNRNLSGLEIYLDDGKMDSYQFYKGCEIVYNILYKKGVKIQNHLNEGEHNTEYILANVEKYLLFYSGKK